MALGTDVQTDLAACSGLVSKRQETWEFHLGGYQVAEKWLRDRKGRTLTYADIEHYQQILVALAEKQRIMPEIDEAIDDHGG